MPTLDYSRRQLVQGFSQQPQRHWLLALEEAFRVWGGVPEPVLLDNAKALITHHNPRSGELVINPAFAAFALKWRLTVEACWPHRSQTKGKDERCVGYGQRNGNSIGEAFGYAEHCVATWVRWRARWSSGTARSLICAAMERPVSGHMSGSSARRPWR